MGIASASCSLHAVSVMLHCLLGVCNLLFASCFDVFIVDGSRLLHCTLRQLNTGNLRCPRDGQSQFLLYPALMQTIQLCCTILAENGACFCCCIVQHVCSAAMLPCLSGVCVLLLAVRLVFIDVFFLFADVFPALDCCV